MLWQFTDAQPRAAGAGRLLALTLMAGLVGGCPSGDDGGRPTHPPVFNNTTDPLNAGATYVGSRACAACHGDVAARTRLHAHSHALVPIDDAAPTYPAQAARAGVPNPPDGKQWTDVSYLIGGYTTGTLFIDAQGYVMTDGVEGVHTQWNLGFPPTATAAGFTAHRPDSRTPLPYDYPCFRCHTTGPAPQDRDLPRSQDGRPGIRGTWAEAGVQCEACHGPGSNHLPRPIARDLFVDATPATCARCHTEGDDPEVIVAADGYINPNTQYAELRASGGHADFNCGTCHDPHASTVYDREHGIRNTCTVCHVDANMAAHGGVVFVRGDYRETMTCQSCHMPFAGLNSATAGPAVVGNTGRMGDVRSHIFRIATREADYTDMFSADGSYVLKDAQERAAVTVDFVCLRCHTDDTAAPNSAFFLSLDSAWQIATGLHRLPQ
jgi:hypothetical protein